ncbi:MAG: bifunctional hydroxymethylpyrimidine kinase/phosphomethylpyrimidine kinase [Acidimicrobiales bacterium]
MTPPVALTIAGSDSGAGAGIQADLKTFAALGVYGTTAITAVTAQSTTEVRRVEPLAPDLVLAQVEAVLDDLPVVAVKTGMLADAAVIAVVADLAEAGRLPNLVVDPVLVSSTGARLLARDAEHLYVDRLLRHARVITPNLAEAAALLGGAITNLDDQRSAARALGAHGPEVVVVKGGHQLPDCGDGDDAVDVVWDGDRCTELRATRIDTANVHGTGCSFASAIAAGLARGLTVDEALRVAKTFVHQAIEGAAPWRLGAGHGPIDHFRFNQEEPT